LICETHQFIFIFQFSDGILHPSLTGDLSLVRYDFVRDVFMCFWVVLSCSVFVHQKTLKTQKNLKPKNFF